MCLAVPARIVETRDEEAVVDLGGNRLRISTVLTPGVEPGCWVLVHAGFAITTVEEREALATWEYLRDEDAANLREEAGGEPASLESSPRARTGGHARDPLQSRETGGGA